MNHRLHRRRPRRPVFQQVERNLERERAMIAQGPGRSPLEAGDRALEA